MITVLNAHPSNYSIRRIDIEYLLEEPKEWIQDHFSPLSLAAKQAIAQYLEAFVKASRNLYRSRKAMDEYRGNDKQYRSLQVSSDKFNHYRFVLEKKAQEQEFCS